MRSRVPLLTGLGTTSLLCRVAPERGLAVRNAGRCDSLLPQSIQRRANCERRLTGLSYILEVEVHVLFFTVNRANGYSEH
jgi:hypothetical protein